jgi:hypothetical protein
VANATRHLKTKHPSQHTEYKDAINHAKDVADVEASLASPPVKSKSRQTQMEDHAVPSSVKLTKPQLHNEFTAWLVTSVRPANVARDPGLMRFLSLVSGDTYKPPHRDTMRKIEKNLNNNVERAFANALYKPTY